MSLYEPVHTAAASNERKTQKSISFLKHHFVVFVRRPSSILRNVTEVYVEFHCLEI